MTAETCTARLDTKRFEGLLSRYPLYREGNKTLYWTIEHHATESLGGYEVQIEGKSQVFFKLDQAVDYFNKGGRKQ